MEERYEYMELSKIIPSPFNPREDFGGPDYDDLKQSIEEKGVITPILTRPKNEHFEIVFGERRWRASCELPGISTIPTIIRDMSDDEAFDLMMIENLHRKNLSELEEANTFKSYLKRYKDDPEALQSLATRTGIHPSYIRRRVVVLSLPKQIVTAWGKGELLYGHMVQLMRVGDKKNQIGMAKEIKLEKLSVKELKTRVERRAPELKTARFDLQQAGCLACNQNSDVQKSLFNIGEIEKSQCTNPKCFKKHQNDWFLKNWKKTGYYKQHHTNGFRFREDLQWNQYEVFYQGGKARKKCRECNNFVTLLNLDGTCDTHPVCIGDKSCYRTVTTSRNKTNAASPGTPVPRATWHGQLFRDKFYKEQIRMRLQDIPGDDDRPIRLALTALLVSNRDFNMWFGEHVAHKESENDYNSTWLSPEEVWRTVQGLFEDEVLKYLREGSLQTSLQGIVDDGTRAKLGVWLGADLERDFRLTEEYLQKKKKDEIHALAEKYGIFDRPEVKTYLFEILLKKRGSFKSCKKGELIRVFLESGTDLAGVIPEEILPGPEGNE